MTSQPKFQLYINLTTSRTTIGICGDEVAVANCQENLPESLVIFFLTAKKGLLNAID